VSDRLPGGGSKRALFLTLAAIALLVAVVLVVPAIRDAASDALHGRTEKLREDLRRPSGVGLVIALSQLHAVIPYPVEILDTAAGYVYGFWSAVALMLACWVVSGLACYAIGRNAARPLLYRLVGEFRFVRLENLIERGGVTFLLAARLVPIVPFSLTGYVAGATRVPLWRFTWTTAVGFLPITALFTYLGSNLEDLSLTDPVLLGGAAGLMLALLGIRHLFPEAGHHPPDHGPPQRHPGAPPGPPGADREPPPQK